MVTIPITLKCNSFTKLDDHTPHIRSRSCSVGVDGSTMWGVSGRMTADGPGKLLGRTEFAETWLPTVN